MNPEQRIKLNELIRTNTSVDKTPLIRELKHSSKIWEDVKKILLLKKMTFLENGQENSNQ